MEVLAERRETGLMTFLPLESMVDFSSTSFGGSAAFDSTKPAVVEDVVRSAASERGSSVVCEVADLWAVEAAAVDKVATSFESAFASGISLFCVVDEFCGIGEFARR